MSRRYYQDQLNSLRELATEFAEAHPALAPRLSGPSPDPDVERILEGVAFLTGNIRKKLDDEFPELVQSLLQLTYPHYLRPVPSATLIGFKPREILNRNLNVPAGIYIDSREINGVRCRFRTCYPLRVSPLTITHAATEDLPGGRLALVLNFELQGMRLSDWQVDKLPLHIAGDYATASDIFYLLLQQTRRVVVQAEGGTPHELSAGAIRSMGLETGEAMLPYPSHAFPAYRVIQEYFLLKEKFLFVEIGDLASWQVRGTGSRFSLRFEFGDLSMRPPRISRENFQLHVTPAINLFEHDADPILYDQKRTEMQIRPARSRENDYQVYEVRSVIGHQRGEAVKQDYQPLGVFDPTLTGKPVYHVSFRHADEGVLPDVYLGISYPPGAEAPGRQTLIVELTCSNGNLPAGLRPGDICMATSNTSELVEFSNLLPPTEAQQPPAGEAMLWRLLSHLALNYLSLADTDNLRALLELYLFVSGRRQEEAANRKRIEGITQVQLHKMDRIMDGAVLRGQQIVIGLNKEKFASLGDLYLFGSILDRLLASFAALNSFTQLVVEETQSGETIKWPARLGTRTLI